MTKRVPLDPKTILDLQRTAGNQYVAGLLRPSRKQQAVVSEPDTVEVVEPEVLPPAEGEAVIAAPLIEPPALKRPSRVRCLVWSIVIGVLAAICLSTALWFGLSGIGRSGAIAAGAASGAIIWFASWRLMSSRGLPRRTS